MIISSGCLVSYPAALRQAQGAAGAVFPYTEVFINETQKTMAILAPLDYLDEVRSRFSYFNS